MLSTKQIMFATFLLLISSFMCHIIEGAFFGATDVDIMNSLTGWNYLSISGAGIWAIPKLAVGFFVNGFPKLIMWDYSFFHGSWGLFRWMLCFALSAGLVYGLSIIFIGVVQGIFSRLHG